MNKQQYSSPYSKVVKVIIPVGLCQGSPLDAYMGNDLGDDFGSEYSGSGENPGNGGSL